MGTITKQVTDELIDDMQEWQKVENAGIASTARIMEKTRNPVVRLVMEIIQRDSMTHHDVQQLIINSLTTDAIHLTPEELAEVWKMIEEHVKLEKKTIEIGQRVIGRIEGSYLTVQQYLLEYLLEDEAKHTNLLNRMDEIKRHMYPYGP